MPEETTTETTTEESVQFILPIPDPEPPFKRPVPEAEWSETKTMTPCDNRIETIVTGHYVYEDGMPTYHYGVGDVEKAEGYFGVEQEIPLPPIDGIQNERHDVNFVVSQNNVNGAGTTHVSKIEDTVLTEGVEEAPQFATAKDPVTGQEFVVITDPEDADLGKVAQIAAEQAAAETEAENTETSTETTT